ncbi:MAG: DNA adenine methylase [Nitrospirota bacterium]
MVKRVLNYPGSKWTIADWIVQHMPQHDSYLEPFFGSGAVFFQKERSVIETVNDLDGNVVNLFSVIRDRGNELARLIQMTPWARDEYELGYDAAVEDPLESARRFLVRCWQAVGNKLCQRTGWKKDIVQTKKYYPGMWNDLPYRILAIATRLKETQIENQDAFKLIPRYNDRRVLIYADPPYMLGVRCSKQYNLELTEWEHGFLLDLLSQHRGPVIISAYDNPLYKDRLRDWRRLSINTYTFGARPRQEVIYLNRTAVQGMDDGAGSV